jgi:hypothetical protein
VSRWAALALGAWAGAAASGLVGLTQRDECRIEGAYFNRSEGAPAYAGVFDSPCDEFTASNPYLWLGAAIALALVGAVVLALLRRRPG